MAQTYKTATFLGRSGTAYKMIVFPFKTTFKEGIGGVYLVTKRTEDEDGKITHDPFFLGSANDLRENFKYHVMAYQFNKYEVNSICVIREGEEAKRREIYADLLEVHTPLLNEMF